MVLAPDDRQLLLDGLRPDPGFVLDCAVGTTYTLNLDALLMAPLAFALFDVDAGAAGVDPLAVLAAVRSYAARTAIYCDGARIHVPPGDRPLFQLLEGTVKPVHVPQGAFHPKVWALRYREVGGERRVLHRALVLSRNLTFDRSWDTVLRLDEDPSRSSGDNALELADFLDELRRRRPADAVDELLATLPRVSFAPPGGFTSVRFWPLFEGRPDPLPGIGARRALVVSPFATQDRLATLGAAAKHRAFVSRADTLERLGGSALKAWDDVFVLHSEADEFDPVGMDPGGAAASLAGLHAKLYVLDDGRERRIFTGSANATRASVERNVELMVELRSTAPETRVDRLLAEPPKGSATLRTLLLPRRPAEEAPRARTPEEQEQDRLERIAAALASSPAVATATLTEDGRWAVDLELSLAGAELLAGDALDARLITAVSPWVPLEHDQLRATGRLLAGQASRVSTFVGLRVTSGSPVDVAPVEFTMVVTLVDAPPEREERLLLDLLTDARRVLQLLFLLLADGRPGTDAADAVRRMLSSHAGDAVDQWSPHLPLFENLVRTFAREPERMRVIGSVIGQLSRTEEGRARIPTDFRELWETFAGAMPKKGSG